MIHKNTNLRFPVKLLPLLSKEDNSVISPYGIETVLSMAAEGANENSLNEILFGLEFNSFDELREAVLSEMDNNRNAFKSKNTITMFKGEDNLELLEQFKNAMRDRYAAVVDEELSSNESFIALQNIADFKAEWLYKMERDIEGGNCFQNADGSWCRPVFLSCTEKMRYYKDKEIDTTVKAVVLPYKVNGEKVPFELVLVDSEKTLTEEMLNEVFAEMKNGKCELDFPEFSIDSEFDLIPIMNQLGVKKIFDKKAEPFARIATEPLYAEKFIQKAKIQVDKNGTVAKALTVMMMTYCTSSVKSKTEKIRFSEPFYYFLRNANTGKILFMGRVNKLLDCKEKNIENEEILKRLEKFREGYN